MKHTLLTTLVALMLTVNSSGVLAKDIEQNLGRTTWLAFECHLYSGKAHYEEESHRLFVLGYDTGREFLQKIADGDLTEQYIRENTPTGITLLLREGGPSHEFILGRIFSSAQRRAFGRVLQIHEQKSIGSGDWRKDEKDYARGLYLASDCEMLE